MASDPNKGGELEREQKRKSESEREGESRVHLDLEKNKFLLILLFLFIYFCFLLIMSITTEIINKVGSKKIIGTKAGIMRAKNPTFHYRSIKH